MAKMTPADVARGRAILSGDPRDMRKAEALAKREREIAEHVARAVADAPPISTERRARIARLLADVA